MNKKPNADKAGQSTPTNELTPGAASAKGQRKTPSKPTNFNGKRAKSMACFLRGISNEQP